MEKLKWRVNTPGLLKEIVECSREGHTFISSIRILQGVLSEVAERAIKLNDKEMNKLMIRLSLYSISDPRSPEFDLDKTSKYLES